jgi:hypothetical protein
MSGAMRWIAAGMFILAVHSAIAADIPRAMPTTGATSRSVELALPEGRCRRDLVSIFISLFLPTPARARSHTGVARSTSVPPVPFRLGHAAAAMTIGLN